MGIQLNRLYIHFLALASSLFCVLSVHSQSDIGRSFLRNITYKEYNAHTQNFAITQSQSGIMYIANFQGILIFDGVNWSKAETRDNTKITTLYTESDTVYFGGTNEIGYIYFDGYKNQVKNLTGFSSIGQVRSFFRYQQQLLVVGETGILTLRNDTLQEYWRPTNRVSEIEKAFLSENNLYIAFQDQLARLQNQTLHPITKAKGVPAFYRSIALLSPQPSNQFLVTQASGVFQLLNDTLYTVPNFYNQALYERSATSALLTSQHEILICTERDGLFRFSQQGELLETINETTGLQNNKVNQAYQTQDRRIWLALNNGLALVDIYLPYRYLNKQTGLSGAVHGVHFHAGNSYIYGDRGVFLYQGSVLSPIKQVQTACWHIIEANQSMYFATSRGLLKYTDKGGEYITNRFTFSLAFDSQTNTLYTGELEGLGKISIGNKRDTDHGLIHSTSREINKLILHNSKLWLGMSAKVIQLYDLKLNQASIIPVDTFPEIISYRLFSLNQQVGISTKDGLFTYNDHERKFLPYTLFYNDTAATQNIGNVFTDAQNNIWYTDWKEMNIQQAHPQQGLYQQGRLLSLNFIDNFITWNVVSDAQKRVWFCGPEGVIYYKPTDDIPMPNAHALFRSLSIGQDSLVFTNNTAQHPTIQRLRIPYNQNTLRFTFGANTVHTQRDLEFQYKLTGLSNNWSNWSKAGFQEFVNLKSGKYTMYVRTRNVFGQHSDQSDITFTILRPYYLTYWAFLFYLVTIVFVVYQVIRWRVRKLNKEKQLLQQVIHDRTQEIVQQKDQLELKSQELNSKNNELQRINHIVQAINAEIDFSNLLTSILEHLKVVKGMDAAVILQPTINNHFRINSTWGLIKHNIQEHEFTQAQIEGAFITEAEEYFDQIYLQDNISPQAHAQLQLWNQARSSVTLVISIDNQISGYLILMNQNHHAAFDSHDKSLLRNLKEHLLSAFIKTRLLANLQTNNNQLSTQNYTITKQQDDIHASILYASRIQGALLPSAENLAEHLPNSFILFRPRNVVSGDFYWMQNIGNQTLYAAADCTGHGVPGAFVSMLAITFLNEIVNHEKTYEPAAILDALRIKIKTSLKQYDPKVEQKDGLDIALCLLDLPNSTLQYAGAYNSLYLVRNAELIEYKANRNPIGVYLKERPFTSQTILLEQGDTLYTFSDGYADQFGGTSGKKLYSKVFKQFLISINSQTMTAQHHTLNKHFDDWRGELEQVDDVLVIGVRI